MQKTGKRLKEFQVRLFDGRLYEVEAWTRGDVLARLDKRDILRSEVQSIRRLKEDPPPYPN